MRRSLIAACLLSIGLMPLAASAESWTREDRARVLAPDGPPGPLCYDAVIVGVGGTYANVESLGDLMGGDGLWFGARSDLRVRVLSTLRGEKIHGAIWVRLLETSMASPGARRLFVLRRIDAGHYWAIDWKMLGRAQGESLLDETSGWLPPPCSGVS